MKRKTVNLVLALVLVMSLGIIAAPVSADYVRSYNSTVGDGVPGEFTYDVKDYDTMYVDADGGADQLTITAAVNLLPFDGGGGDPAGSTTGVDDLIVVETPLVQYGGDLRPEEIAIHFPVTIVSREGDAEAAEPYSPITPVDLTGQSEGVPSFNPTPYEVILITCPDVIIDGLYLIGDATNNTFNGVTVDPSFSPFFEPEGGWGPEPINNVQILNCTIKMEDDAGNPVFGIEMYKVKYPIIENNNILVGADCDLSCPLVTEGWGWCGPFVAHHVGIYLDDCFTSTITNNDIDVKDDEEAYGIAMKDCPKSLVGGTGDTNDIDVRAAIDAIAYGIKVDDSDLIQIVDNEVAATAHSSDKVKAWGIHVDDSDRADVLDNYVCVDIQLATPEPETGILVGRGIEMEDSDELLVDGNEVWVNGVAAYDLGTVGFTAVDEDLLEELEDLAEELLETLGMHSLCDYNLGTIKGIYMDNCDAGCVVSTNTVDTQLNLGGTTMPDEASTEGVAGYNAGIHCYKSSDITVMQNTVDDADTLLTIMQNTVDDADTLLTINANAGSECCAGPPAYLSVAHGIVLQRCGNGAVDENTSLADADIVANLIDVGDCLWPFEETESALSLFSGEVLNGILESVSETGDAAIEISGGGDLNPTFFGPKPIICMATSTGILALKSDDVSIEDNPLVSGDAYADVTLVADDDSWFIFPDSSQGGAMAFGVGIGVIDCDGPTVNGNGQDGEVIIMTENGVYGTGETDVTVEVGTPSEPMTDHSTVAEGEGSAVGVGILLMRDADEIDTDWYGGGFPWCTPAVVTNNVAYGSADACPTTIQSATEYTGWFSFAKAEGTSMAVAMGIAADNYHGLLIGGNEAVADANACLDVDAFGEDTYCPDAEGDAVAIGAGISATRCFGAEIIDNSVVKGEGSAVSNITADEDWSTMDAEGEGGALGVGIGISVFECPLGLIQGNSDIDEMCEIQGAVTGLGDAECHVNATTDVPLNEAEAMGMAVGLGIGIGVFESPKTDVIRCNVATGEGTARVTATAEGDFDYAYYCGFAGDYDIIMKLYYQRCHGFTEEDIDAEHGGSWWRFGDVNYNSMVDYADPLPGTSASILEDDAGLLKIGKPCLDATLNWWNDPTGPSGMGPGIVEEYAAGKFNPEPVMWEVGGWQVCPVEFQPWLYVDHAEVLCEQIGKFGFAVKLCKGLNTFSTPIALEEDVEPSREWGDIFANSDLAGKILFIDKWDASTQSWVEDISADETIDPLDAYYIYSLGPCTNIILYVNSSSGHPYSMPTQELYAGWNLVGPNPLWPDDGMRARHALSSVALTPMGLPGYTQVMSPVVFCQDPWAFVPDMFGPGPKMVSGRGYWLWMENDEDILVGFGFTPLPAGP